MVGLAGIAVAATACSSTPKAVARTTSTTTAPSTSTTRAPAPTTFPAVVVQAMGEFNPLPAGAEAPIELPAVTGYVTAQTGGLGGQDNVTLIATATAIPVDSPQLASASAGREIASFSTTATASTANASAALTQARSQSIASCGGPASPVTLPDGTAATTCPTLDGAAVNWSIGPWQIQVMTLDGTTPSTTEAGHVDMLLRVGAFPASDAGGIVSVVVPGKPSAGAADTAALEWTRGAAVYQVRSSDDPDSAIAVASAMRPYPA